MYSPKILENRLKEIADAFTFPTICTKKMSVSVLFHSLALTKTMSLLAIIP